MQLPWKRILICVIPLLIMIFIFVQSALPADLSSEESGFFVDFICRRLKADPEIVTFVVRKAAHMSEYFALGMSLAAAFFTGVTGKEKARVKTVFPAGIIGIVYAVSDEIHQRFVPGRSGELRDVLIDSVGVICGLAFMWFILERRRLKVLQQGSGQQRQKN